jgi:hypothetical protein
MYNQWMPAANRLLVMEEGDRSECDRIVGSRKTAVSITKRAQMLVLAAGGLSNRRIALELGANEHVVGRVRKEYRQRGLAVLEDRARPGRPRSRGNGRAAAIRPNKPDRLRAEFSLFSWSWHFF